MFPISLIGVLFYSICLLASVMGNSSGPPSSACESMSPSHGSESAQTVTGDMLPYEITADKTTVVGRRLIIM